MAHLGERRRWSPVDADISEFSDEPRTLSHTGDRDVESSLTREEAFREAASLLRQPDGDLIRAWADQADGLVTFAALFSGVVTAFLVDSNASLQPDQQAIAVDLLRQISAQLAGQPLPSVPAANVLFKPALSAVVQNALLFASLICSLLSAGLGVFHKEWLREYTLYLPLDPQQLLRVVQHRYEGRNTFKLWFTIAAISIFLQLGVAFFIGATLVSVWPMFPILRNMLGVFIIIWLIFWVGTAFCPTFASNCPFKSPLARVIFVGMHLVPHFARRALCRTPGGRMLPGLEEQELRDIMQDRRGESLDRHALEYLCAAHPGDRRIRALERYMHERPSKPNDALQAADKEAELHSRSPLPADRNGEETSGPGFPHPWRKSPPQLEDGEADKTKQAFVLTPFRRGSTGTTSSCDP